MTHGKTSRQTDHRTLVAIERREKTRAKLLRGAIQVFAQHGAEAKVIDLVIREAGVSRGTFYNYFRTNEELFLEVSREVSNEIILSVDPLVLQQKDAGAGLACGLVSVVRLAGSYPLFAQFVSKGGPLALSAGNLTKTAVTREIRNGIAAGLFTVTDEQLAFDLILGPVIMAFHTVLSGGASESYARDMAQAVLCSLGVDDARARQYAWLDFEDVDIPESSIFRSYPQATQESAPWSR
jgi:AcrR family transcriptional regulator